MKSVRKLLILLIFVAVLVLPSNSYAWPGQPGGVYSYTWGNPLKYDNDNIAWTTQPGDQSIDEQIRGLPWNTYAIPVTNHGTRGLRPCFTDVR